MYSFDSRVRYSECDAAGRLTLVGLVNYLQDCSIFHTEELGHGVSYLRDHHVAWFLSAWQIEIVRLPHFCEHITVSTWCYDVTRTQAGRNFTVTTSAGDALVRADSLWFTFDTHARRPIRIPDHEYVYREDRQRLDMPVTERKLHVGGTFAETSPIVVAPQHLDTNGHVNNAHYLAMAVDALADAGEVADVAGLRRLCVQYRQMALLGDTVIPRVYAAATSAERTVELTGPGGVTYAVVRLEGAGDDAG